ncbi:MAG: nucleoside/nucleotide kinase family protein [Dermatophilaceae bacterium]
MSVRHLAPGDPLVGAASALTRPGERALIGVAGEPGVGKSTFAAALVAALCDAHGEGWAVVVPMDGFHLAGVHLERMRLLDRKGSPETFDPDGYAALLERLRAEPGGVVYAPGFDRTLEEPLAGAVAVPPETRLVVTEGNYLLHDTGSWRRVRAALDAVWLLEDDPGPRRARLVQRHVRFGKSQADAVAWVARVDEPNAALVRAAAAASDVVIRPAADGWQATSPE